MTYKTIALALSIPIDFERIKKTANYYSNGKLFIDFYRNGTCVFPRILAKEKVDDSAKLLTSLAEYPIDFIVREMDDHNFIIGFSDSVFSIVFADEFFKHLNEISLQAASSENDEVVIGKSNAPQEHILLGLYARTRLIEDIKKPELIGFVEPHTLSRETELSVGEKINGISLD